MGVCEDIHTKVRLLQALTRKFILDDDIDLAYIAELCPQNLTGADFYALCSDAMLKSISASISSIDQELAEWNKEKHSGHPFPTSSIYYLDYIASKEQTKIKVGTDHFLQALNDLKPSITADELYRYNQIRKQFEPALVDHVDQKGKKKAV